MVGCEETVQGALAAVSSGPTISASSGEVASRLDSMVFRVSHVTRRSHFMSVSSSTCGGRDKGGEELRAHDWGHNYWLAWKLAGTLFSGGCQ